MIQFIKFALVGVANTLVDLGILNVLIAIFNINKGGSGYFIAKAVSFSFAVVNSYILNRYWVFRGASSGTTSEKSSFILISVMGLLINTLVSSLIFAAVPQFMPNVSVTLIANAAALCGTAAVLLFNFFGYKRFVFRTVTS